ncbi:hypothetical protein [Campylobacter sp. 19-13652]|uniref:hypothetical protein n=1 Tax=Campylobacter sp. 19-13652 TaxID=2840180 RepID=UPI001C78B4FD|nr:hypothetical protein [Campylobacter sp. 19-13652]BCX79818.1 hypothetical protein LBC_12800 [Campylobacter sp. 19-13652]
MLDEWLNRLSKREGMLLSIALFLVVFSIAFFTSRMAYESRSARYLQTIIKLQSDIESLNEFISKNRQNQIEFESLKLSLKQLQAQKDSLGSNLEILKLNESDAISIILKGAKSIDVRVDSVSTKSDGEVSSVSVTVVIFASFNKLMQFLSYIEKRLYVDDVNITKSSGTLKGEFNVLLLRA